MFYGMNYEMKLGEEPFIAIKENRKVIESRLYDEKRQVISLGDTITFIHNEDVEQKTTRVVTGLLRYQYFKQLFEDHEAALFGGERNTAQLLQQIKQFYSDTDEEKYGVVGIRLALID